MSKLIFVFNAHLHQFINVALPQLEELMITNRRQCQKDFEQVKNAQLFQ